ncbi:hypothetical protein GTA08_BOTSDO07498 [Neofusicoccum parvum]|uniref:Uncharacterized protein n=2 Tax=Neofusicoccum parvum TaxID=310453 RepID=R1GL06_BOTPV|nr:hypothetical protein UCRNP2_836 [Neofusicoccum parvum UCRNP2]GME33334.1 hypothetical protein GTA08_BOTSDO07498 [Neofusicoccum parvum]GME37278.1 hypothetical protein GTA08_BOTSDO07498 [Neofusicoccum parvum]
MKLSLLTAFLLPIAAQACAQYKFCHCYDSNGVPNDRATAQVCSGLTGIASMVGVSKDSDGARECAAAKDKTLGNCSFRQWCKIAGATGADSSCRMKD